MCHIRKSLCAIPILFPLVVSVGLICMVFAVLPHMTYGYSEADLQKLLETNDCPGGDLSNVDLKDGGLDGAN